MTSSILSVLPALKCPSNTTSQTQSQISDDNGFSDHLKNAQTQARQPDPPQSTNDTKQPDKSAKPAKANKSLAKADTTQATDPKAKAPAKTPDAQDDAKATDDSDTDAKKTAENPPLATMQNPLQIQAKLKAPAPTRDMNNAKSPDEEDPKNSPDATANANQQVVNPINDQSKSTTDDKSKPRQKPSQTATNVDPTAAASVNPVTIDAGNQTVQPSDPNENDSQASIPNASALPGAPGKNLPNVSPLKSLNSKIGSTEADAANTNSSQSFQLPVNADDSADVATPTVSPDEQSHLPVKLDAALPTPASTLLGHDGTDLKTPANSTITAAAPVAPAPTSAADNISDPNHAKIVSVIHGQLLPGGGTMQIRLDPPELGALQITIKVQDGSISASFQTSNDDATQLLSHTLGQLKHALQMQGISVEKLHVEQVPRSETPNGKSRDEGGQQEQATDDRSAQQEQQRREIMRRMWRRASIGNDPLDLVA